jgi:hypothetical protein
MILGALGHLERLVLGQMLGIVYRVGETSIRAKTYFMLPPIFPVRGPCAVVEIYSLLVSEDQFLHSMHICAGNQAAGFKDQLVI